MGARPADSGRGPISTAPRNKVQTRRAPCQNPARPRIAVTAGSSLTLFHVKHPPHGVERWGNAWSEPKALVNA
jgi:hypothetical protein